MLGPRSKFKYNELQFYQFLDGELERKFSTDENEGVFMLFFFHCVLLYSIAQSPFLVVLGTTQDGVLSFRCSKKCCEMLFSSPDPSRKL